MSIRTARFTVLAASSLLLGGCFFGHSAISPETYRGPTITDGELEGRHLITLQAPGPGWLATIDDTERRLDVTRIFVTLRRPDPGMLYASRAVEQDILTSVVASRDIEVFVRTIDFGRKATKPPYRQADLNDGALTLLPD